MLLERGRSGPWHPIFTLPFVFWLAPDLLHCLLTNILPFSFWPQISKRSGLSIRCLNLDCLRAQCLAQLLNKRKISWSWNSELFMVPCIVTRIEMSLAGPLPLQPDWRSQTSFQDFSGCWGHETRINVSWRFAKIRESVDLDTLK
jgi:hypothetical protein